jgi:hypothetical protein
MLPWHLFRRPSTPTPLRSAKPTLEALEERIVLSGPGLTLPMGGSVIEGQPLSLAVTATDSGASLTFAASGLPIGISINTTSGLLSGVVAHNDTSAGSTVMDFPTISVGDGAGDTVSASMVFAVSDTDRLLALENPTLGDLLDRHPDRPGGST